MTAGCAAHGARVQPSPRDPATRLRQDLTAVFNAPIMAHGQWAVDIRAVDARQPLFSLNAGKLMMPASNMKILTLAAAAETLGWDARLTTTLETSAPVEGGVLRGDLVVRGEGDPTINTREGRAQAVFAEWARTLAADGITSIDGRIVGDDEAFDDEWLGGGWAWDYLQYGYAAPVGALQYNEDVAELVITPGTTEGEVAVAKMSGAAGLTVVNKTVTGPAGSVERIEYRRHLHLPLLEITGTIPAGGKPATRSVAVVNP